MAETGKNCFGIQLTTSHMNVSYWVQRHLQMQMYFCIHAAAKVKKSDIAKELGASSYVFWGGREGYESLLNTDMKLETDNLARFFKLAKSLRR